MIANFSLLQHSANYSYEWCSSIISLLQSLQTQQIQILEKLEEGKSLLVLIQKQQVAQAEELSSLLSGLRYLHEKCPAFCELVSFLCKRFLLFYECIYNTLIHILSFLYTYFPSLANHISLEEFSFIFSVSALLIFLWKGFCFYKALKAFFCAAVVAARAVLTLSARHLLGDRWTGLNPPAEVEYPLPPGNMLVDMPLINDDNSDNASVSSGGNSINEATQIAAETYFRERQNVSEAEGGEALLNELAEGVVQSATNLASEFIDSSLVLNVTEQILGDIVGEIVQEQQDFPPEVPGGSGVGAQQSLESPIDTSYNHAEAGGSFSYHPTGQGTSNNNERSAALPSKNLWKWPKFSFKPMAQFRAETNDYFQHEHEINAGLHPRHPLQGEACRAIVPMGRNNTTLSSWYTRLFAEESRGSVLHNIPNPTLEKSEPCKAIMPIESNSLWYTRLFGGEEGVDVTDLKKNAVSVMKNTFRIIIRGFRP